MTVNIDPARWGKRLWQSLHYMAYAFPEQPTDAQKQAALQMLSSLRELLPCEKCRQHYSAMLAEHPPTVESRTAFATYLNKIHNQVNARLDKEQVPYDPCVVYGKPRNDWLRILVAVVIGIVVGLLLKSVV
jgi:hypothetical protein